MPEEKRTGKRESQTSKGVLNIALFKAVVLWVVIVGNEKA